MKCSDERKKYNSIFMTKLYQFLEGILVNLCVQVFLFLLAVQTKFTTLSFFTPENNETKKVLETHSRSVTTDYTTYVHYIPKNDKLTYGSNRAVFLTEFHSLHSPLQIFQKERKR